VDVDVDVDVEDDDVDVVPISTPTATKLSQKPGCIHAQGSHASTTAIAAAAKVYQGHTRPLKRNTTASPSINTVRCAGTPHPANTA
jgi:hypothetical protein